MKKTTAIGLFLLSSILAAIISYFYVRNYNMTHFSCSSLNVVIDGSKRSSFRSDVIFDGGKGIATLDGIIEDGKSLPQPLRLIVTFKINHNQSIYTFTHTSTEALSGSESSTKQLTGMSPRYLTVQANELKMTRLSQGQKGYIFTSGTNMMYCGKSLSDDVG